MEQKSNALESTRVVIIGSGFVGSTAAFAILAQGISSEVVLIDTNKEKCIGEVLDLEQAASFVPRAKVWAGDYADCANADIIVITAGVGQKPGQTRMEIADVDAKIMKEIISNIRPYATNAIILVVSNPLDVMTYVALKESGFPKQKVFGTGTTLDSARLRYYLGGEFHLDPENIEAYILGEHGDTSVPIISHMNVMGESLANFPEYSEEKVRKAFLSARDSAYEIIKRKGATYYAIAFVIARMVRAILDDEGHAFPVSTLLEGEFGLHDVCLSVPALVGRSGVQKIIPLTLSEFEQEQLQKSAQAIRSVIDTVLPK